MNLGDRFKFYRKKAGLKQNQAAVLIGVKNYQLANYESNRSEPTIATLKKMSNAYKVSIDKLVGHIRADAPSQFDNDPISIEDIVKALDEISKRVKKNNHELSEDLNKE